MKRFACAFLVVLAACGTDGNGDDLADQPGFWFEARDTTVAPRNREGLDGLGYADGYVPPADGLGVTVYVESKAQPGLNLYSSGHGSEARLVDMEGETLHRWAADYDDLDGAPEMEHASQLGWRRVRLLDDGSLLAIHGGLVLFRLDRDSKVQWVYPGRAHHDLDVAGKRVFTLTRGPRVVPSLHPTQEIVDERVAIVDLDTGEPIEEFSLVEPILESRVGDALRRNARNAERVLPMTIDGVDLMDLIHANSIRVLDGSHAEREPAFAKGNLLMCLRELNVIVVLDPRTKEIVWYREGRWLFPHDPRLTDAGTLTLFDNMGHAGKSQVLEIDPVEGKLVWSYRTSPAADFFSQFCGATSRLANGNTLVTESCNGRAFEVTNDGDVVWEFRSPHRAGSDDQFVAVLFEVERIDPERTASWLER